MGVHTAVSIEPEEALMGLPAGPEGFLVVGDTLGLSLESSVIWHNWLPYP